MAIDRTDEMINVLGIKWVPKGNGGGSSPDDCDVNVTGKGRQRRISFSRIIGELFDDYIKVCRVADRLYFMSSAVYDNQSYKFDHNAGKSTRKSFQVSNSILGDLSCFDGRHKLERVPDTSIYFINKEETT